MSEAGATHEEKLHRRGLRLELFTICWNAVEVFVAVGAGLVTGSVALLAFGADSLIEITASAALLWRLRRAGPHASAQRRGAAERRSMYVVSATFFVLAAYIAYEAIGALLSNSEPESSLVGVALAVLSLAVMPVLAYLKQRTGRRHAQDRRGDARTAPGLRRHPGVAAGPG